MSFEDKLRRLTERHRELGDLLAREGGVDAAEFGRLSKEYSDLTPIVATIQAVEEARKELASLQTMMADASSDADMRALAEEEYHALKARIPELERQLQIELLPKDAADEKNAILEVRAGTGGEEAALFAAVLFRMYQRYAENHGWRFEVMDVADTGLGGIKEASASITGRGVFARLKFESGVHRVQRVPETESSGRIHTSAGGGGCRRPYRGKRSADRSVPRVRPGRPVGQHHRQRGAHHPYPDRGGGQPAG